MREDALIIYDYLVKRVGVKAKDVVLFGRSLGSGPASFLASQRDTFCLFLMSAYTSIKDVSKSLLGKLRYILTPIVRERFKNLDSIKEVKCPVFLLHGAKDKLIPPSHAYELKKACSTICQLVEPENMDHNEFDFKKDFIAPFQGFLKLIEEAYRTEKEIDGIENVIPTEEDFLKANKTPVL